jgi:hypothetical protein
MMSVADILLMPMHEKSRNDSLDDFYSRPQLEPVCTLTHQRCKQLGRPLGIVHLCSVEGIDQAIFFTADKVLVT